MEGERILQDLKTGKDLENIFERASNYVAPLFHAECNKKVFSKLELFSLKLFKLSLEYGKAGSRESLRSVPTSCVFIDLCVLAVDCLLVCSGASGDKIPPLSFEKLLLHFAQLCVRHGNYDRAMETCRQLRKRLDNGGREGEGKNQSEEEDTLLKHAFDLSWKAALSLEQQKDEFKNDGMQSSVNLCLCLREEAFACLLTARDTNFVFVVERVMRSSQRYQHQLLGRKSCTISMESTASTQYFERLYKFHTFLLSLCNLPKILISSENISLAVDYLCLLAKISHYSSHAHQTEEYLTQANAVCSSLEDNERKVSRGRNKRTIPKKCEDAAGENKGNTPRGTKSVLTALVNLTFALVYIDEVNSKKEDKVIVCLQEVAVEMEKVVSNCRDLSQLNQIWEASEQVFTQLDKHRVNSLKKRKGEGSTPVVTRGFFPSLLSVMTIHVKLGEVRLKVGGVNEQVVRSSQLSTLNLVTQILLSFLLLRPEEEYPAIETPRSSRVTPALQPHSSDTPSSLLCRQACEKGILVSACLPLLEQSRSVICAASKGVLDTVEHRWLGNNGYNLGLALFRMDLMEEACDVLNLGCEELRMWCEAGDGDRERAARWRESQLLKKTSFLVDCLRDSGRHGNVMETLSSTAAILPAAVLCESREEGESGGSVEVIVEMWVRGKRELSERRPDSASTQRWKDRTLLSLLPPAHPPLSTRHKAHILTTEFTKLAYQRSGSTNQNAVAVGHQLLTVYKEGGWEWDVERGRVMVTMAIADRSLLDEAIDLLVGVVSDDNDHIYTPIHRHQAHLHLATAHTMKAVTVLQDNIGSSEVRSHDPLPKSHDQDDDVTDENVIMIDNEMEKHLTNAVDSWCNWGGWEGGEREGGGERIFYYLRLTADLCFLTQKFELAIKTLGVLVKIYERSPDPSLTVIYQNSLAQYCELVIHSRISRGTDYDRGVVMKFLQGVVCDNQGGSEIMSSYLSCRVALASLYLHQGEVDKCRTILVNVFQDSFLARRSISAHTLTAYTRLTAARLLLTRHTPLLSLKQFLTHILTNDQQPSVVVQGRGSDAMCHVTSIELATTAVKTLSNLFEHCSVESSKDKDCGDDKDLTSDLKSWGTLGRLLDGLVFLSRLLLVQGLLREALYYAREGANLAKKMALGSWYREFVGIMTNIHITRGDTHKAHNLLSPDHLPDTPSSPSHSPHTQSHIAHLHSALYATDIQTTLEQAERHLDLSNPSQSLIICKEAIENASRYHDFRHHLVVAELHYTIGRALLEDVAISRPVLLEELWGRAVGGHGTREKRRGRGKVTRTLGWLSLVPEPFQEALNHFCQALQLCHPTCPPHLLREVYQWLSMLVSPYHQQLAAHFLLHSSNISLSHRATITLGKKIRKQRHSEHSFDDVLKTLQDEFEVCPDGSNDPLLLARAVLQPPSYPPPLSITTSLLSSLPNECQFTIISIAPKLICQEEDQDHLLLCAVGKNREPLFVKTLINSRELLTEFSSMLNESEESLKLSEKKAWWGTRRRLDRRMKDFVNSLQSKWLGIHADVFVPPPPTPEGTTGYHLLCIGRLLQHLPWEAIPILRGQAVGRSPSLSFTVAHNTLQTTQNKGVVDPDRGYYVLNPRGDLPDTEKRFHGWFEKELGWRGVVGHAPSSAQFSEALQNHDVFVYCGHGTGREFLSTDNFQLLSCQATTLLMGCGSGKLVVGGACDPAGMALTYLLAGCPSLVAVLWDVTDGDIDKLSKSLLEQWLEEDKEAEELSNVPLSLALAEARSVCKLEGLNGYAAVVYGNPTIYSC